MKPTDTTPDGMKRGPEFVSERFDPTSPWWATPNRSLITAPEASAEPPPTPLVRRRRKPRALQTAQLAGGNVVPFPVQKGQPVPQAAADFYPPGRREEVHRMVDVFLDALHAAYGPGAQRQPDTDPAS